MINHGDYIIYADESGDHSLTSIDKEFPLFGLSFCIFKKSNYTSKIVPKIQDFKFRYWGHDTVVFHEREIRKQESEFAILRESESFRRRFFEDLNSVIIESEFDIISAVIEKDRLVKKYTQPYSPYNLGLRFCLERTLEFLVKQNQEDKTIFIVFESRGKKEDKDLELEFRRMCDNSGKLKKRKDNFKKIDFQIKFASKHTNSSGMQLADLTARPIAINVMRPTQENRAYDIIREKIADNGIKIFP